MNDNLQNESDIFDQWVKQFFLDPDTQILDTKTFPIDLFESEDEYFIEAILENLCTEDIHVYLCNQSITISVHNHCPHGLSKQSFSDVIERTITFPFPIGCRKLYAKYTDSLLVIQIHKYLSCSIQTDIPIH